MAKMYSSHPIANYSVGRFQFTNTVMTLENDDDIEEFEKLHKKLPPIEQHRIKPIDVDAAERFVQSVLSQMPKATQTIDSSQGGEATRSVGTGRLEDLNQSNTEYADAGEDTPPLSTNRVENREGNNPGTITNQEKPAGSGDTTSGENHGAGNIGDETQPDAEELNQAAAKQGTQINEQQRAGESAVKEFLNQETAKDAKPKLGNLAKNK